MCSRIQKDNNQETGTFRYAYSINHKLQIQYAHCILYKSTLDLHTAYYKSRFQIWKDCVLCNSEEADIGCAVGGVTSSHVCDLGVIFRGGEGGGCGGSPLSGVVETVLPSLEGRGVVAMTAENHGSAEETKGGAHPSGVERPAERHQAFVVVGTNGKPDG